MIASGCRVCLRATQCQSIRQLPKAQSFLSTSALRNSTSTLSNRERSAAPSLTNSGADSTTSDSHEPQLARPSLIQTANTRLFKSTNSPISNSYTAYAATEALYQLCRNQADYNIPQAADKDADMPKTEDGEDLGVGKGWWYNEMGLKPTFGAWSHVTMFHMYFFLVRFRCFPTEESRMWQQHFFDHFFYDAEDRMLINHRMHARQTRNKYLKDLHLQWRGSIAAYDEGMVRGDAWLAAAIWRNVFKADSDIDAGKLALSVSYMRRFLRTLDLTSDAELAQADVELVHPREEGILVGAKSKGIQVPADKVSSGEEVKS